MENGIIIDSSVFIDYFRKPNKENSLLRKLLRKYPKAYISAIAKYEVLCGAKDVDLEFWQRTFRMIVVLSFDNTTIEMACQVHRQLKRDRCLIDMGDILIAATAIVNDLPLATLNQNHFERIDGLRLVETLNI